MELDVGGVRQWLRRLVKGEANRRQFIRLMLNVGLAGPFVSNLLATAAPAATSGYAVPPAFPRYRGGGGRLRLLWWQAPTVLNAHLAVGMKDADAARVVYEPLAAFNRAGDFIPILAAEIPSYHNGGLTREGTSVTWHLKTDVVWHDGQPFSADDVIFTWEYAADPATAAVTSGSYQNIRYIEKLDAHTVKVIFKQPTPFWYDAFFGSRGHILPKHLLADYKGQHSRNAPYNLKPVGTGPYKIVDFKPGNVALYEINPHYHVPNRPFFDTVELKGGGDATSAARAVLQTGEFDYAWNLQVEKAVLESIARQGRHGQVLIYPGSSLEHLQLNRADPWTEVEGERSSVKVPHPFLTELLVRQACNVAVDRRVIADELYGAAGQPTSNFLDSPGRFQSPNTRWEFNPQQAIELLQHAGWRRSREGALLKDGHRMRLLYQTSVNPVRQKTQAIVKKALEQLGIAVDLKAVNAGVFFSSDPGNPDSCAHFYADLQMYTVSPEAPDPQAHLNQFVSWEIAQKANHWAGRNIVRWANAAYDRLWKLAEIELDPVKRAELFIRMNDLLIEDVVVIPLVWRHGVSAASHRLRGLAPTAWDSELWDLAYWYRDPS